MATAVSTTQPSFKLGNYTVTPETIAQILSGQSSISLDTLANSLKAQLVNEGAKLSAAIAAWNPVLGTITAGIDLLLQTLPISIADFDAKKQAILQGIQKSASLLVSSSVPMPQGVPTTTNSISISASGKYDPQNYKTKVIAVPYDTTLNVSGSATIMRTWSIFGQEVGNNGAGLYLVSQSGTTTIFEKKSLAGAMVGFVGEDTYTINVSIPITAGLYELVAIPGVEKQDDQISATVTYAVPTTATQPSQKGGTSPLLIIGGGIALVYLLSKKR